MPERRIPLSDLAYGVEEEEAVARVLRSRWLTTGPEVEAFEAEFAAYLGVKHAIAVSSGTAALHLAYLGLGLGPGDEVIQPALNFVAAANLTAAVGATPVFADIISSDEPTLDPALLERALTPATAAVVVMHYGGYLSRMAEIMEICSARGVPVIEDACHAVGAHFGDRRAGALGRVGCFSFFSNKNLAVGEGGMLVTDDPALAADVRLLRSHGMTTMTWQRHRGHASSYDVLRHGFNYRSDEIRAALGRAQLAKLDSNNARRRLLAELYRARLEGLEGWAVPFADHVGDSAHHLMVVLAPDPQTRDSTVSRLNHAGVQTSLHYPCITGFAAFAGSAHVVPRSEDFTRRAITLPLHPGLSAAEVEEICGLIRNGAGRWANGANAPK